MTARDSSSAARRSAARRSAARRSAARRPVDPSRGALERDTGPTPALRGLGWGLLVAVVAAVVLFSTVLVVQARSRLPQPAPSPVVAASPSTAPVDPTAPQAAPTGPRSGALASSPPVPVPPPGADPGPDPQPGPPATTAPPADDTPPRRPVTEGLSSTTTGLRSVDSRTRAVLVLVNGTDGPVDVEWIDYRGQRVDYGRIDEDEQMVLETFVTHPWIVSDADGEDLGAALPRAPRSTVLVEEPG